MCAHGQCRWITGEAWGRASAGDSATTLELWMASAPWNDSIGLSVAGFLQENQINDRKGTENYWRVSPTLVIYQLFIIYFKTLCSNDIWWVTVTAKTTPAVAQCFTNRTLSPYSLSPQLLAIIGCRTDTNFSSALILRIGNGPSRSSASRR